MRGGRLSTSRGTWQSGSNVAIPEILPLLLSKLVAFSGLDTIEANGVF